MKVIDCHTHNVNAYNAIINVNSKNFNFEDTKTYSVGLHPWNIENASAGFISSLDHALATHRNIVAIGEAGIDKLISTPISEQENIFAAQIELSEKHHKPIIVHCVRAWQEIMKLHKSTKASQPWIIHGFRGKPSVLNDLIKGNFYISYGEKFNAQSLQATPLDRLLIETDESTCSISEIAQNIAKALAVDYTELCHIAAANAAAVFFTK